MAGETVSSLRLISESTNVTKQQALKAWHEAQYALSQLQVLIRRLP